MLLIHNANDFISYQQRRRLASLQFSARGFGYKRNFRMMTTPGGVCTKSPGTYSHTA